MAFRLFMESRAGQAQALYILGDFFNIWIGDDDTDDFGRQVGDVLAAFTASGSALYLMHGNRDFLLGEAFCRRAGATLIQEPTVVHCFGQDYLLMHGDALCTKDTDYMAFRAMVRDAQWQRDFLAKPLAERRAFADKARAGSKAMASNKAEDIMDVSPDEVIRQMSALGQKTLIHGHTHRPAVHDLSVDGAPARRIVLGDWDSHGWYLEISARDCALKSFPVPAIQA